MGRGCAGAAPGRQPWGLLRAPFIRSFQEPPGPLLTARWPSYRVIISLGKQTLQPSNMVFPGAGISTGSPVGKSSAKTLIPRKGLVN